MPRLGDAVDRFQEATTLHRAGALEQAEEIYREMLREDAEHAGAWHRLGAALHARGELPQALEHMQRALALCDTKAVYWNNYGVVLKDIERREEARIAFQRAVDLHHDYADAWSNLGLMQIEVGDLDDAGQSIHIALRLEPQHADALRNLALLAREKGELTRALRLCQDAIAVAPSKGENYDVAGGILRALSRFGEAATAYETARQCNPSAVDMQLNLGHAYSDLDEIDKARVAFREAAEMRPDLPMWQLRHLSLCPTIFQTADELTEYRAHLERQLDKALEDPPAFDWRAAQRDGFTPSFQLCHHGVGNRQLKEKYASLFARHFPRERPKRERRGKTRVGFVCTRGHEGGFMRGFGGVMERLDAARFEVAGLVSQAALPFCHGKVRSDDVTWVGLPNHLERAGELIGQAECDVIMHWHSGTDLMNYFLPFLPLAPVQCIGFGTHGTTGISDMDYFVSSRLFERGDEADDDYTENLIQFDGATSWQPRLPKPQPAKRSDFGLPETGALYFCPQRHAKFHPDFDRVLRGVLEGDTAGTVIILQGQRPKAAEALRIRLANALGETLAKRVLFVPTQTPPNYYRLLSVVDVVLDAPVYSASLTGYDAFSLGVPMVTLPGRHMVQRYAHGLYQQMGVSELTVGNEQQYIDLSCQLGCEPEYRESVRKTILDRRDTLYERDSVVREYEEFFVQVAEEART